MLDAIPQEKVAPYMNEIDELKARDIYMNNK